MTIVLLTFCVFMFILITTTLILDVLLMIPGWRERREAERRNHVH